MENVTSADTPVTAYSTAQISEKGFRGNCSGCGQLGHKAAECPVTGVKSLHESNWWEGEWPSEEPEAESNHGKIASMGDPRIWGTRWWNGKNKGC